MVRRARPHLTLLALLTASGLLCAGEGLKPLSMAQLSAIRGQESLRARQINTSMEASKPSLGLLDGLKATHQFTDAYGRTHVRYTQTHRGVEVWNGNLIGHLDAMGAVLPASATVQSGIHLQTVPLLDEARVKAIALENLPHKEGTVFHTTFKPIVFPTADQDGLKVRRDKNGKPGIDVDYSVAATPKSEPYVWAYHVSVAQDVNKQLASTEFVVDGVTGEILKKWNGLQYDGPAPAVGTGNSYYNGVVNINTLQNADHTYSLVDAFRPTKPWPFAAAHPEIPQLAGIGSKVCYSASSIIQNFFVYGDADNTWGDGLIFSAPNYWETPAMETENGQTTAVDAAHALQVTWDYYKNVLGRDGGIDGQGSSMVSVVHADFARFNAFWSGAFFLMAFGDGFQNGSSAALDVAAHEMSHGVMQYTAGLAYRGESGGLNEANSDIHAIMMKYYMWGADGVGATIPDTTTQAPGGQNTADYLWTVGAQLATDGTPLRWCTKPSKDGFSADAWFDGVDTFDVHYSSGPGNRAFYFLSQGVTTTGDTSSPYLPGGMTGIGNDKAIKIWFNAMATKVTDINTDYHAVRDAMVASATELYGATEVAAVKTAFAAINVGVPDGVAEPVQVAFYHNPIGRWFNIDKFIVAPSFYPVPLTANVTNATDKSLVWKLEVPVSHSTTGAKGKILDGNFYLAPNLLGLDSSYITATSKQDPNQFASGFVLPVGLDVDGDMDLDACDMGALALNFGGTGAYIFASIVGPTSIIDVEIFKQGFNTVFNR